MSLEQLKAFLAKVKDDSSIKTKLQAAKSTEEVVGIAKEHGHEFSPEHITDLRSSALERLAGGNVGCVERTACWNVENSLD